MSATLANWQNFYVILGSSAGALTGLQFVVITLVTQARAAGNMRDIHAFATPTVIHFCTVLLVSAIMTAPWQDLAILGLCLGASAVLGIAYSLRIVRHARRATYKPGLEDWVWYVLVPLFAHMVLLAAAILIRWNAQCAVVVISVDALVFLFVGVHNAWDAVTYIAVEHVGRANSEKKVDRLNSDTP